MRIVLLLIFLSSVAFASSSNLFVIERTSDINQIYYTASLNKKGLLNIDNPIAIYWVKHTDGNRVTPLTWLQNKYGYGLKFLTKKEDYALFHFAASDKRTFELKKDAKGQFRVFTPCKTGQMVVSRIFIHNNGGTFMAPKISEVEIFGANSQTGDLVVEKMKF